MRPVWVLGATALLAAFPAAGQSVIGAKSGVVNLAEGQVYLNDQLLEPGPTQFPDVKETAVLRTAEGRAEVLLTPGVVLRLWEQSSFKMISNRLIDTRVELLSGSAIIEADDVQKDAALTFVVKDATITIAKPGLYRINLDPAQFRVVNHGPADVKIGDQMVSVAQGKMVTLGGAVAVAEKFTIADTDSFDHWSRRRGEILATANASAANHSGGSMAPNPCANYRTYAINNGGGGTWGYNPYYGLITYIPCNGTLWSPYGYRFWSPGAIYRAFYAPHPIYTPPSGGGGFGGPSYSTMPSTSSGYSGTMAASSSVASSPAASSSVGSSAASSAGSSSVGHGGGGGGGRGH